MVNQFKYKILLLFGFIFFLPATILFAEGPVLTPKELTNAPHRIIRTCCAFGANIGFAGVPLAKKTDITSPSNLGPHNYLGGKDEHNGNIYTRRGGFLDFGHLRDCADWTAYLYELIQASKDNKDLRIADLGIEGGQKWLTLHFPKNISKEEAIELAGKIAYDLSLWHEISTWFGASYVPMVPERYSSFSPEDLYSNLMGVHLSMEALRSELPYNEAMTLAISNKLEELEAMNTEEETLNAMLKVDQLWYNSEKRFPSRKVLIKRYLDSESELVPWLVPGEESVQPPYLLEKPDDYLNEYYELNLKLNFKFPVKNMFSDEKNRFVTQKDFGIFMEYIQNDLIELQVLDEKQENRSSKRKENIERDVNLN